MKRNFTLLSVFCFSALLESCALSPHGGIAPIWSVNPRTHKIKGGNAISFEDAVVFTGGTVDTVRGREINWLGGKGINDEFTVERLWRAGRLYDILTTSSSKYYFDLTQLAR
jgi:hypothetical protein